MATTTVPVVATIHFDDLVEQFRLKITSLLEAPGDNEPVETVLKALSLLGIVADIITAWTAGGAGASVPFADRPPWLGDVDAFKAFITTRFPPAP